MFGLSGVHTRIVTTSTISVGGGQFLTETQAKQLSACCTIWDGSHYICIETVPGSSDKHNDNSV